jgi:hypothetical protein
MPGRIEKQRSISSLLMYSRPMIYKQRTEVGGQKTEDKGQKSEVGDQRSEVQDSKFKVRMSYRLIFYIVRITYNK